MGVGPSLDELVKEEELSRQEIIRRAILDRCKRATPRRLQTAPIAWWSGGVTCSTDSALCDRSREFTLEDLLGLVHRLGIGPVRALGLLEAAIARPQSSAFGEDAYPTIKPDHQAQSRRSPR